MREMPNTTNVARVPMKSQRRLLTGPENPSQNSKTTQQRPEIFSEGFPKNVRLWPKLMDTVKGKISQGAKILKVKRIERVFEQNFSVRPEEKLVKAAHCKLQTTAGPIAGVLFISTDRAAFCSDKPIKISSPGGEVLRCHYKILIPLTKIKRVVESKSLKKPSEKYIQVVTDDNFEFWFMGFLNHQRIVKHLQQVISETRCLYILRQNSELCY